MRILIILRYDGKRYLKTADDICRLKNNNPHLWYDMLVFDQLFMYTYTQKFSHSFYILKIIFIIIH